MSAKTVVVSAEELTALVTRIFERHGMSAAHAGHVADVLIWADAGGHGSHGVSRVGRYLDFIARGDLDPKATPRIGLEFGAITRLDCGRAAGAVAMREATATAGRLAGAHGIGLCLARETTHIGGAGYFAQKLAQAGQIGIVIAASGPLMAYHGAAAAAVSTAPLAIGVPAATGAPLLLDMASSVAALGKIRQAAVAGREIPAGWALDRQGLPTTDPSAADIQLPLGGPKGSGLALMFECLSSLLAGAPILTAALAPGAKKRHVQNATVIAIDIGRFLPLDQFQAEVDRLADTIRALPRMEDGPIVMPGQRSQTTRVEALGSGITVRRKVWDELNGLLGR